MSKGLYTNQAVTAGLAKGGICTYYPCDEDNSYGTLQITFSPTQYCFELITASDFVGTSYQPGLYLKMPNDFIKTGGPSNGIINVTTPISCLIFFEYYSNETQYDYLEFYLDDPYGGTIKVTANDIDVPHGQVYEFVIDLKTIEGSSSGMWWLDHVDIYYRPKFDYACSWDIYQVPLL